MFGQNNSEHVIIKINYENLRCTQINEKQANKACCIKTQLLCHEYYITHDVGDWRVLLFMDVCICKFCHLVCKAMCALSWMSDIYHAVETTATFIIIIVDDLMMIFYCYLVSTA